MGAALSTVCGLERVGDPGQRTRHWGLPGSALPIPTCSCLFLRKFSLVPVKKQPGCCLWSWESFANIKKGRSLTRCAGPGEHSHRENPQLGSVQPITAGGPVRGPTPAPTPTGMLVLGYILNAGVWGKYTHTNKDKAKRSEESESTWEDKANAWGDTAKAERLIRKKLDTLGDYDSQQESQAACFTFHLASLWLD